MDSLHAALPDRAALERRALFILTDTVGGDTVTRGEPLELFEFPLAPRTLADVAVRRRLQAPEIVARIDDDESLTCFLAPKWRPDGTRNPIEIQRLKDDDGKPLVSGPVDPDTGRPNRFAYPPNLVVVDGGQPQVAAAQRVFDELGVEDVALVGLAKRLEEVWLPGEDFPLILPRTSPGLYLLQRLRDEAHRFAITAHRSRRSKAMTRSVLDDIPGLGPTRAAALLKHFGSVAKVRDRKSVV